MKKLIFVLLMFCGQHVMAELPPKTQAERYLTQSEQERRQGDYYNASKSMEKLLALHKQYPDQVKLPSEFYFKYARILALAKQHKKAVDAIQHYIESTGEEGKNYRQASVLLEQEETFLAQKKVKERAQRKKEITNQLWTALKKGADFKEVERLIIAGSDIHTNGKESFNDLLGTDIDRQDSKYFAPVHLAAYIGSTDTVALLLKYGVDMDVRDDGGRPPLWWATRGKSVETVSLLLDAGADVYAKNNQGNTALHIAAAVNFVDVVNLFLEQGAYINAKNNYGDTPLHHAAWYDASWTARLLLEQGAHVNAKDYEGWTPLHFAAQADAHWIAELFLEKGAEVNAKNKDNRTPLRLAVRANARETAKLLRNHGGKE